MRVFLLNGIPVSLLVEALEHGIDILEFGSMKVETLRNVLNEAVEIVNAIRHPSTRDLVLSLVERKEKVRDVQFISLREVKSDDMIIVVAPKQLSQRGQEMSVTWEDLAIITLYFRGLPI